MWKFIYIHRSSLARGPLENGTNHFRDGSTSRRTAWSGSRTFRVSSSPPFRLATCCYCTDDLHSPQSSRLNPWNPVWHDVNELFRLSGGTLPYPDVKLEDSTHMSPILGPDQPGIPWDNAPSGAGPSRISSGNNIPPIVIPPLQAGRSASNPIELDFSDEEESTLLQQDTMPWRGRERSDSLDSEPPFRAPRAFSPPPTQPPETPAPLLEEHQEEDEDEDEEEELPFPAIRSHSQDPVPGTQTSEPSRLTAEQVRSCPSPLHCSHALHRKGNNERGHRRPGIRRRVDAHPSTS